MAVGKIKSLILADGVDIAAPDLVTGAKAVIEDTTTWTAEGEQTAFFDVSAYISDASKAVWQFQRDEGAGEWKIMGCEISAINTSVSVTANLPAGTYRLVGIF